MKAPRYSLGRLLLSVTLFAIGLGIEVWCFGPPRTEVKHQIGPYLDLVGFALIGAGLFLPFKRPLLGAILCIVAWFYFLGLMALLFRTVWKW